jgi:hypothetical protein
MGVQLSSSHVVARIALWALPWACILAISASIAFALNVNLSGTQVYAPIAAEYSSATTLAASNRSCDLSRGGTLNVSMSAWLLGRGGEHDCAR